jgi:hypothetical protein
MRSLHPLFFLGVSVLYASSTAAAVSNDIQMPHRLFREGILRKSAGVSSDAVIERNHAGDDGSVVGEVSWDGSDEAAQGWFENNRQESGDELQLSLPNAEEGEVEIEVGTDIIEIGTDITEEIDDNDNSEIDPDCVEVEVMVAAPLINRRKNLLRRHLESKTHKASKEQENHLAKTGKAATSVNTLPNSQIPPPVSNTGDAATSPNVYQPKSDEGVQVLQSTPEAKSGKTSKVGKVSNTGDAATSPNVYQPKSDEGNQALQSTPEAKSGKTSKVGKAAKGCKSGKSCKMVVKCTSPPSKAPSAATTTDPPVRTKTCRSR